MFGSLHPQEMVRLQKYSVVMRIDRPKLAMMKMSQAQRIRISTMITLNLSLSLSYIYTCISYVARTARENWRTECIFSRVQ